MFIKIVDIIINTNNITSINEDKNNRKVIEIHFTSGKYCSFQDISLNEIEYQLGKIDQNKNEPDRLEILDL